MKIEEVVDYPILVEKQHIGDYERIFITANPVEFPEPSLTKDNVKHVVNPNFRKKTVFEIPINKQLFNVGNTYLILPKNLRWLNIKLDMIGKTRYQIFKHIIFSLLNYVLPKRNNK